MLLANRLACVLATISRPAKIGTVSVEQLATHQRRLSETNHFPPCLPQLLAVEIRLSLRMTWRTGSANLRQSTIEQWLVQ
jgi:hypothetical protein